MVPTKFSFSIIDSYTTQLGFGSRGGTPDGYSGPGNIDLVEPSPTGDGIASKIRSQVRENRTRATKYPLFDIRLNTQFTWPTS